ncbi:MAG: ribonuclease E inhibitor RraB [Planctomycetaceae bacterium]|nr:ribonuclease E inhibitor RraB [Planctomycetaceae bacterium]
MANDDYSDDAQVLSTLADSGHDLTQPMLVEFEVLTDSETSADAIADAAEQAGFAAHVYSGQAADESTEVSDPKTSAAQIVWVCVCSTKMVVDADSLAAARQRLTAMAEKQGGRVESWGTFGNADDSPGR